ncbi:MAG: hypothetical protein CMJ75_05090 [Planctomycetaceae bacterium]|nr:hypothetical protein [Planctomycetaceae bacterium]
MVVRVKTWLLKRWFLIALAAVLVVGFSGAELFASLADAPLLRRGIVAVVLFVMALPLGLNAVWRAIRYPGPSLLAAGINFGLLPVVAWGLYLAVMVPIGLNDQLAVGILIAAATPSTLASAAVWTRRAGGDDTVPVLVTLITNLSCFVVTPLWLVTMTGEQVGAVQLGPMVIKLLCLIVLPMSAAQLCRLRVPVRDWAADHKSVLGVVAQCGVLAMILVGSVRAGLSIRQAETAAASAGIWDYGVMIGLVLTIHLSMLAVGHLVGVWLGMARGARIAVGFAGSQKTLLVGLTVAVEDYGVLALAVLPMVAYHVGQLLVDTLIADRLRAATLEASH